MASVYDNPALQQARSGAQAAQGVAGRAEAEGMTLPDLLKDTLMKKFASPENPLIQNREQALTRYLNESTRAPLRVTPGAAGGEAPVIFNPLEQANLIQGYRAAPLAALTSANTMLGMQRGGIADVIGEASRAHQGYTRGLQSEAELKRQQYKDLLDEMSMRADEAYKNASLAQKEGRASLPAALRSKANAFESALRLVDAFNAGPASALKGGGPITGRLTKLLKNIAPGFVNKELATAQSDIGPFREGVLNALSGAQITDKETQRIQSWLPDISKSQEENIRNLNSLRNYLKTNFEVITDESYDMGPEAGAGGSASDPLGIL